jgi:hypothetical protein
MHTLLEYINYNKEKFASRWQSEGKPFIDVIGEDGDGFVTWLELYDPSPAKKYVNWMIVRYLRGDIKRLEDIPSRISGALKKYMSLGNKKKLKPEHRDINRISDIEDIVDEYSDVDVTSKSEMADKYVSSGEANIVYDDNEYKVIIPKTEEASCYYGRNTRWCTASRNNNMFKHYDVDGPLYIILHKPTNTRWQFHFNSNQYMDERDEPINIIDFFKKHKTIFGVFKKLGKVDYKPNQWIIGNTYYNNDNQLHREDGPAVERADGTKRWYINDKLHRIDGPAVEYPNGSKIWYQNDKRHRIDGPAVEDADGTKIWWINGQVHRIDGPAVEYSDGSKSWWINGKLHRIDGPAVERADGTKRWYQNGKLHRIDGPAVEDADGTKSWWINDKPYSYDEWKDIVSRMSSSSSSVNENFIKRLKYLSGII